MKKYKSYIPLLIAGALGLNGCTKDFLDKKPSEFVSDSQLADFAEQDPTVLAGYINGIYGKMYEVGSGGTTGHDDFGQKGYDIYMDMLSGDMVLAGDNYGWYENIANLTATENYTVNQAYMPWRYYYSIIYATNSLIATLGGNDANPEDETNRHLLGQAKTLRAYSYFYLTNLYSREGYGDGSAKILPIYTEPAVANSPKSTSKEVFDLMISDLNDAVEKLDGFVRSAKSQVDGNVAKGILSYVLAARGTNSDLQQVVSLTGDVISNSGATVTPKLSVVANFDQNGQLTNPQSGFNDINNSSWLWGFDLTLANDLDLVSWWGQIDYFTYSYAWAGDPKIIDDKLYAEIPEDDLRKTQFDEDLWPTGKFFAPDRVVGGQRYIVTDYVYLRLDELVLLNAEANAKLGNEADAKSSLKSLLEERFADESSYAYVDQLSGQALKDEIYLQTRIELWGEGKAYLALKRNKETVHRGDNHLFFPGQSYPYNDPKLTFLIPQAEELNNPNLNK